jgi:NTE family protein
MSDTASNSVRNSDSNRIFVFQGGGALGAYQAGAYEALHKHEVEPDWLAGISIGAINAAIVAGSPRESRIANLRAFWDMVSSSPGFGFGESDSSLRRMNNDLAAMAGTLFGVPGFFSPRLYTPFQLAVNPAALISYYDTDPLVKTLEALIDFDLLNDGSTRLSLGAVDVQSGNFAYFDNRQTKLDARHIAASGALPPGFAPIEIDGRFYWDGGLVSNTPLQHVLAVNEATRDLEIFQVDLFSARGAMPRDQFEVESRVKEIRYSSRTRMNTDEFARKQVVRRAAKRLLEKLPPEFLDDEDARILRSIGQEYDVTIVHLIHRRAAYATHAMDVEFSRRSINEHWQAGYDDVSYTLNHSKWRNRGRPKDGIQIFDLARERHDKRAVAS